MSKFKVGDTVASDSTHLRVLQTGLKGVDGPAFLGEVIKGYNARSVGTHSVHYESCYSKVPKTVTVSTDYWEYNYLMGDEVHTWTVREGHKLRAEEQREYHRRTNKRPTPIIKVTKTITYEE